MLIFHYSCLLPIIRIILYPRIVIFKGLILCVGELRLWWRILPTVLGLKAGLTALGTAMGSFGGLIRRGKRLGDLVEVLLNCSMGPL